MINLILALLIVFSSTVSLDYIVFVFKRAPKQALFLRTAWKIAFITNIILVFYVVNGFKFSL